MAKPASRRQQRYLASRARTRRLVVTGVATVVLAVIVVVGLVVASGGGGSGAFVARLTLDEFSIGGDLEVPAGPVEIDAVNVGVLPHNVGIRRGPIGADLPPGGRGTVDLGVLEPGTYELYCDLPDHVEQGMVATLTVTG